MSEHLFFVGKGGVGKSTVSSLIAIKLSLGKKVLLVSLDPAHNLSDIFNDSFSDIPKTVSDNLSVIEIDVKKKIKKYLKNIENDLVRSNTGLSAFNLLNEFDIIKHSPGIEEYGILLAYAEIIKKYELFDSIIFDTPPTALTLKFFNLPHLSLLWLEKLIDLRNRIKEKKEIVSRIKFGKIELEGDRILSKLQSQYNFYINIIETFKDSKTTKINLVVNQDKLSMEEGRRIEEEFAVNKIFISEIFINKYKQNLEFSLDYFKDIKLTYIKHSDKSLFSLESLKDFIVNENYN